MTQTKQEKQKLQGLWASTPKTALLAIFLVATISVGCAPMQSGRWYDSEKDRPTKSSTTKVDENTGGIGSAWAKLREKLDRRPEARKAREEAKVESAGQQKSQYKNAGKAASKTSKTNASGLVEVAKGDTYYSLSRVHKVPLRALLEANNARPPYVLSPGDRVRLPNQTFYEVRKKDTLYSISRAHKTDIATLAKLNGLTKPYAISVGQRLQIPGLGAASASLSASLKATEQAGRPIGKSAGKSETKLKKLPAAPKRVGRFLVPVKGAIISTFGPKEGGLHNDGINISARAGAPIRAAENGVVVYTGNELRGYGNLLLIRHSGGWVTAYAHTSKFLVRPGARVKQGDVVAEVGRTGNVDRPQLHFELRKGTRAVNPQSLI